MTHNVNSSPPDEPEADTDALEPVTSIDEAARAIGVDPESYRYWQAAVAKQPPMTEQDIHAVAAVLNRIDQRRKQQAAQATRR
jgi:hypothetical protein